MLEILKYTLEYKNRWDEFIISSKNGAFLFLRNYMEYHSDRFSDCSYLIIENGSIEAVLPGNITNNFWYSHEGLTFGGLISSNKITTPKTIEIFKLLCNELKKNGILKVVYKPIPLIYHSIPAQEDIYALFIQNAVKIGCNISSVIFQSHKLRFSELRRRGIQKGIREKIEIAESTDFSSFWDILDINLTQKFNTKPVHSLNEIKLLKNWFPENIKLYTAKKDGIIIAGTVLYLINNVVKVQYISADEWGKKVGALDLLFDTLVNQKYLHMPIFDFGVSTENRGKYLNENLIFQKEGFGGRGIVYEIYEFRV